EVARFVVDARGTRQDDHRDRRECRTLEELSAQVPAVHHRHHEVEHDQRGLLLVETAQCLGAVGRGHRWISVVLEDLLEIGAEFFAPPHEQDEARHGYCLSAAGKCTANVLPAPSSDCSSTWPPSAVVSALTSARPRPTPGRCFWLVRSSCSNGSNTRA